MWRRQARRAVIKISLVLIPRRGQVSSLQSPDRSSVSSISSKSASCNRLASSGCSAITLCLLTGILRHIKQLIHAALGHIAAIVSLGANRFRTFVFQIFIRPIHQRPMCHRLSSPAQCPSYHSKLRPLIAKSRCFTVLPNKTSANVCPLHAIGHIQSRQFAKRGKHIHRLHQTIHPAPPAIASSG